MPPPSPTNWACYTDDKPELSDRYTGMEGNSAESNDRIFPGNHGPVSQQAGHRDGIPRLSSPSRAQWPWHSPGQVQALFADGSRERYRLPAEVWMTGNSRFVKEIYSDKPILAFVLDPDHLLPDTDRSNDVFPRSDGRMQFETADLRK
ncbi:MAG: hypothetical protein U0176_01455 [Bacteroidia bacterium]